MQIKNRYIIIGSIIILLASFFSGVFVSNKRWVDDYNQLSIESEDERLRTRETIRELEQTVERDGAIINDLRSENIRIGELTTELRLENKRLRDIQSATQGIYRGLENVLRSDMELIDKIISVARALQEANGLLETNNN